MNRGQEKVKAKTDSQLTTSAVKESDPLRVAVVCDYLEERWTSMDLVADLMLNHFESDHSDSLYAERIRPKMKQGFRSLSGLLSERRTLNADRLLNRFFAYPRYLSKIQNTFDVFHVVDQAYAQLVHSLPAHRTVVTCHDLDCFRCLLNPADSRSRLYTKVMDHVLEGFKKAACIVCISESTRRELLSYGIVPASRVRLIPNGIDDLYRAEPDEEADALARGFLGKHATQSTVLLNVGTVIPRKRIDILLEVFAQLRQQRNDVVLVRIGGRFTPEQEQHAKRLNVFESILVLPYVETRVLAALYRASALVVQPAEREGFGLPVVEALGCGTAVIASDLAVFREIAGEAAAYSPVGDVPAWVRHIANLLAERDNGSGRWSERRTLGLSRAADFSWSKHVSELVDVYRALV